MYEITIDIPETEQHYPVTVGKDLLSGEWIEEKVRGYRCVIISDDTTAQIYGWPLHKNLLQRGIEAHLFTLPDGEASKSREMKIFIEDKMFQAGLGRDTYIIALGGGVITDLAGFIAATYCRGIPLIMAPTSLLAMVDACIGGKNGVNTPSGKNLIGTIYHPRAILMDVTTLSSLPERELRNGMVEVIKHGLIADKELFQYLEKSFGKIIHKDLDALETAIVASCHIKKTIIEEDVREKGKRRLVNFGHTVGHALEVLSNYSLRHGEAIALGIIAACELSKEIAGMAEEEVERVKQLIHRCCPDLPKVKAGPHEALSIMRMDKKAFGGVPRFVLLSAIGHPVDYEGRYCTPVSDEAIIQVVKSFIE